MPHATRTLINADETTTVAAVAAEDPTGRTPRPASREPRPQLERMFPGRRFDELTPAERYAVTKEDGLARRALAPEGMAFVIERDAWSVHYDVSRDDSLFMGDGGDETRVAFAKDGRWINLFRVQRDGTLRREKLVGMAAHDYVTGRGGVEPNGSITPDKRWVIFTGNFHGARHVYAAS